MTDRCHETPHRPHRPQILSFLYLEMIGLITTWLELDWRCDSDYTD